MRKFATLLFCILTTFCFAQQKSYITKTIGSWSFEKFPSHYYITPAKTKYEKNPYSGLTVAYHEYTSMGQELGLLLTMRADGVNPSYASYDYKPGVIVYTVNFFPNSKIIQKIKNMNEKGDYDGPQVLRTLNESGNGYTETITVYENGVLKTINGVKQTAQLPVTKDTVWTNYTHTKGNSLVSNDIRASAIDAQGNKWFCTDYGISKFDGKIWSNYSLEDGLVSTTVNAIAIDAQGNKWFGTIAGVSMFDGTKWTTYTIANGLVDNNIQTIVLDAKGNKWFGTGYGVSMFDGTKWTTYTKANGLVSYSVNAISIDAQGNIWFGTSKGVSKFDGKNWTTFNDANGLVNNAVNAITIDAQGNIWFGTSKGVSKFDGTNWTTFNDANGLVNNAVNAITIDKQGDIWFGTGASMQGGGASMFDGTNWTSYKEEIGLDSYVNTIVIDTNDYIWFGTNKGVSKFSGHVLGKK